MFKLFKKIFKKENSVSVYAIFADQPILDENGKIKNKGLIPVTFTADDKQAELALDRLLYIKHLSHFKSWFYFSGHTESMKPSYDSDLWKEYKNTVLQNRGEDFYVLKLTYTGSEMASLLRVFSDCEPLCLPYEDLSEVSNYISVHADQEGKFVLSKELSLAMEYDDKLRLEVETAYTKVAAKAMKNKK